MGHESGTRGSGDDGGAGLSQLGDSRMSTSSRKYGESDRSG